VAVISASVLSPSSRLAVIPAKAGIHFDFVFGFGLSRCAITGSRPCVFSSAILAAESLSLLAQRK
jgi:hypothetical protein